MAHLITACAKVFVSTHIHTHTKSSKRVHIHTHSRVLCSGSIVGYRVILRPHIPQPVSKGDVSVKDGDGLIPGVVSEVFEQDPATQRGNLQRLYI